MRWIWSAEAYGALVLATTLAGSWRTGWTVRAAAWALFASWAVSRLLVGRLGLSELAVAHCFLHIGLAILFVLLLTRGQAVWLLLATALAALQAVGNIAVVVLVDPLETGPRPRYDLLVAVLFGLQLACIWLALTRWGRTRPRARQAR